MHVGPILDKMQSNDNEGDFSTFLDAWKSVSTRKDTLNVWYPEDLEAQEKRARVRIKEMVVGIDLVVVENKTINV